MAPSNDACLWQPEFNLWKPHKGGCREPTLQGCPLPSTLVLSISVPTSLVPPTHNIPDTHMVNMPAKHPYT